MKRETPLRILVADSGSVSRGVLTALTASQISWQVCGEASSGEESVEKTGQLSPDIIVLDSDLPNQGGLAAARQIAELYPDQKTILLTPSEEAATVRKIFDAGAHGFLLKTNATRDLVLAIERVNVGRTFYSAKGAELVLRECLKPGAPEEILTNRQRNILTLLAEEFSSTFGRTYNRRLRKTRAPYKLVAAFALASALTLWAVYALNPAYADRSLVALGLKSIPPNGSQGNPDTKVWIELRTALYYCPGEDRYALDSKGRFEKQVQAQLEHFEPASRRACE
jgi:DNA-binding NarL/FixJ family response regulator